MKHLCKGITETHGVSLRNSGPWNARGRGAGQNDVALASTVLATSFVIFASARTIMEDFGEVGIAKKETSGLAPTGTKCAHASTMKNSMACLAKFHNARELEEVTREGVLEAPRNGQLLTDVDNLERKASQFIFNFYTVEVVFGPVGLIRHTPRELRSTNDASSISGQ